jgi:hypothetical protein
MKSLISQINERKIPEPRQYVQCQKRKGWPRVPVEVCKACKLECKDKP